MEIDVLILHGIPWRIFHFSHGIAQWALTFFAVLQIFSFRESGENQIEKADDVLQKVEQTLNDF